MMRTLAFVLVLVGLSATAASAQAVQPFNALQFYTEAEFRAAVAPYAAAASANANDATAHYWLGVAYLHVARQHRAGLSPWASGAAAQAIQSLERSVSLRPTLASMLALWDAYVTAGELEKGVVMMSRLSGMAPPLPLR
ncbi:MAG TPA: hypothetical protein VI007_01120 [bacterium]